MVHYQYKVVSLDKDGNLVSLYARGEFLQKYTVGEWVETKKELFGLGYGICVFSEINIELAKHFIDTDRKIFLTACEGIMNLPEKRLAIERTFSIKASDIKDALENTYCFVDDWGNHARMYNKVKLIREVGLEWFTP